MTVGMSVSKARKSEWERAKLSLHTVARPNIARLVRREEDLQS